MLVIAAIFWLLAGILLGLEILAYFGILLLGTGSLAIERKKISLLAGVPLAIAVMHVCWGSGFLISVISRPFKS